MYMQQQITRLPRELVHAVLTAYMYMYIVTTGMSTACKLRIVQEIMCHMSYAARSADFSREKRSYLKMGNVGISYNWGEPHTKE